MELQYFNISCKNKLEILTNQFPKAPLKITKEGAPYLILKQSKEKLFSDAEYSKAKFVCAYRRMISHQQLLRITSLLRRE